MHNSMRTMFPAPKLAADGDEEEIRALFGIVDDPEPDDEPTTDTEPEGSSATTDPEPDAQTGNDGDSEEDTTPADPENSAKETTPSAKKTPEDTQVNPEDKFINKQAHTFAQMRIQNKAMHDLIMDLAKNTGQDPKNIAEAQDLLRDSLNKVVSKNRNIPEDVLREMEADKRKLAEYEQTQTRQKVLSGFQQVKDLHGLSREDVNNFADKLIENNLNPYEQDIDLVKEYRNLYFDELIAKAKEEGVQAERARSIKAQTNSTTPSSQKGLPENTGNQASPIKTVEDLNKLLDGLK